MKNNNSISVIVPVHNGESTICECVGSILNQLERDDELIIIDDYSMDRTMSMLHNYIEDDRVTVISNKKNQGVSWSRNLGINKSRNPFITFVDADDVLLPKWRNSIKNSLMSNDDLIVYGFESFDVETSVKKRVCPRKSKKTIIENVYELDKGGLFASSCNKIYRRGKLIDNGISFNINAKILEDYEFNLKYISFCNNISIICKCLYKYIYRQNSASSSFNSEIYNRYIYIKNFRRGIYIDHFNFNQESLYTLEAQSLVECISYLYKGNLKDNKKERMKIIRRIYSDGEMRVFRRRNIGKSFILKIMRFTSIIRYPMIFDFIHTTLRRIKKIHLINIYFRKINNANQVKKR